MGSIEVEQLEKTEIANQKTEQIVPKNGDQSDLDGNANSSSCDSGTASPVPNVIGNMRDRPSPDLGSSSNKCPVCESTGNKLCQGCHSIYYCCVDHQKEHWKKHKAHCCPYIVKESQELGRHLVAARSLKPGSVIYQELPISYGPRMDDNSNGSRDYVNEDQHDVPICLSCCKKISGSAMCPKCRWPICSNSCAKAKPHSDYECNYFKQNKIKYSKHAMSSSKKMISSGLLYRGILILRTILKKDLLQQSKSWDELMKLQSERSDGCNVHYLDKDTMVFFKTFFKLNSIKLCDFGEWNKLNGIIEVNSYSIERAEKEHEEPSQVQLLFLKSGLLSHSCVPNCSWGVAYSPNFSMKVRAAKQISKGAVISVSYNQSWNYFGTPKRKDMILKTAGFVCCCERCSDSSHNELGTYMSAMKCRYSQCSGYLLQDRETKPFVWKCTNSDCQNGVAHENVQNELKSIEDELSNIQSICSTLPSPLMGLGIMDDFIRRFAQVLHPNHWILQQVARFIIGVQGVQLMRLDLKNLNQFIQQCNYLLRIYDILAPGISLDRALLQMYLSRAMYLLYCATYKKNTNGLVDADPKDKQNMLTKIRCLQEDAWLYWKDDIQTKQLNEDIGFEARSLKSEMINILTEISNL